MLHLFEREPKVSSWKWSRIFISYDDLNKTLDPPTPFISISYVNSANGMN